MDPVEPSEPSSEANEQHPDPAAALNQIIDDSGPREASGQWAVDQLAAGQSVEAVVEELIAGGWSTDDAEEIAEQARRQTRHLRGGITHEDAARAYQVGDPNVVGRVMPFGQSQVLGPLGGMSLIGSAIGLCRAVARLWRTRNVGRKK